MSEASAKVGMQRAEWLADPLLSEWQALPTETEIYILPDGEIVVADLPVELAALLAGIQILDTSEVKSSS